LTAVPCMSPGSGAAGTKTVNCSSSGTAVAVPVDLSSGPPFNLTGGGASTITGGTAKNAGITGTSTFTFHGQLLTADAAGHAFTWSESTSTGTINRP
jgi:hypothetical protein